MFQKNINAAGDVAGGDIIKIEQQNPKSRLAGIVEQLKQKIGEDPQAEEFVESLLSWLNPKKTEFKRDLREKLEACGNAHLIVEALEAKELFAKQLKKTAFNPAVQEIYAYILGEVYSTFNNRIKWKIAASEKRGEVESAIADLAENITNQIVEAPVSLGIGLPEVVGMLYYLTGNCHLEWDYDASLPPSN